MSKRTSPSIGCWARSGGLTNEQLIVLIDQAWEEYRGRAGFSLEAPRRHRRKKNDS